MGTSIRVSKCGYGLNFFLVGEVDGSIHSLLAYRCSYRR